MANVTEKIYSDKRTAVLDAGEVGNSCGHQMFH